MRQWILAALVLVGCPMTYAEAPDMNDSDRLVADPRAMDGSRADGTIVMEVLVSHLSEEEFVWEDVWKDAAPIALKRCRAWGFSKVEPFGGQQGECIMDDPPYGLCPVSRVRKTYQCSGPTATE